MPPYKTNLSASAAFSVRPDRSQVVLVSLIIGSIVSLILGAILIAIDKQGWVFVALAVVLMGAVVWGWQRSQRDTDLAQAHPTTVALSDGANLSTDSRIFSSQDRVQNFVQLVEALALRKPLPEPSGLVDSNGSVIPGSMQEAVRVVDNINEETQMFHDQTLERLRKGMKGDDIPQSPKGFETPPPGEGEGSKVSNVISD